MSLEIEGEQFQAGPGSLVHFPAGVPHRNWNAGAEPTVHLAINVPQPDPAVPFARSVTS
jgi:quercetin dioxygenase-like cupin family protein